MSLFHLAFPVKDISRTRNFYIDVLGCALGRSSEKWIDFNLGGHQISAHLLNTSMSNSSNEVEKDIVPIPHFGLILDKEEWSEMRGRIEKAGIGFRVAPKIRFLNEIGEQGTFFVDDPSGNVLEFKFFSNPAEIFG